MNGAGHPTPSTAAPGLRGDRTQFVRTQRHRKEVCKAFRPATLPFEGAGAIQPSGRTPIHAAWAQNANAAQPMTPAASATNVREVLPAG